LFINHFPDRYRFVPFVQAFKRYMTIIKAGSTPEFIGTILNKMTWREASYAGDGTAQRGIAMCSWAILMG
jgi:hypothetical protein